VKTESLVEHIESHLGKMDFGWTLQQSLSNVQVACFHDRPVVRASTYVTIGLSHHILRMPGNREVRQELVFTVYDSFDAEKIASFLLTFSDYIITKREALLRGQVVGPTEPIVPGIKMNAVYAAIPVLFDDSFATFDGTSPPTVFVWLLPLHASEASYVQDNGWNKFEDLLEEKDPKLLDLNRQSVV
jgi:hypothetical protein